MDKPTLYVKSPLLIWMDKRGGRSNTFNFHDNDVYHGPKLVWLKDTYFFMFVRESDLEIIIIEYDHNITLSRHDCLVTLWSSKHVVWSACKLQLCLLYCSRHQYSGYNPLQKFVNAPTVSPTFYSKWNNFDQLSGFWIVSQKN